MEKHTPGPWKAIIHGNEQYPYPLDIVSEDDSCWIARDGTASSLENARLLAAAPDLLRALEGMLALAKDEGKPGESWPAAEAAITKATK